MTRDWKVTAGTWSVWRTVSQSPDSSPILSTRDGRKPRAGKRLRGKRLLVYSERATCGGLAELADAQDLGSCVERRVGSSPSAPIRPTCGPPSAHRRFAHGGPDFARLTRERATSRQASPRIRDVCRTIAAQPRRRAFASATSVNERRATIASLQSSHAGRPGTRARLSSRRTAPLPFSGGQNQYRTSGRERVGA
jgi:hypothetical protein